LAGFRGGGTRNGRGSLKKRKIPEGEKKKGGVKIKMLGNRRGCHLTGEKGGARREGAEEARCLFVMGRPKSLDHWETGWQAATRRAKRS